MTLEPGHRVARFTLVRRLGAGGMGEVWEASDDQLARSVAIKVLHTGDDARLVREARVLAKLAHPAVVTVFDAGTDADRVWIAMELVTGGTLRDWLGEPRGWREVVEMFVPIGRGLAHAHAATLVHRDFKPENVLMRATGQPVVADFGLARLEGATAERGSADANRDTQPGAGENPVTRGAIAGTPPYMAPEQHLGRDLDARADQFAFAVALWEGVFGIRPFAAATDDPDAWALAIIHARRAPPPPSRHAPRWLRAILDRALAGDREGRYPDLAAMVRALERGLARRRTLAVAGLAAAALATTVLVTTATHADPPAPCEGAAARMTGVWDPSRRDQVRAGFAASGAAFAAATLERIEPLLDDRRDAWIAMHTEACRATNIERTQSAELLERRMACLEQRRSELAALVAALAHPDAGAVAAAPAAIAGSPPLASCADRVALAARRPRDPNPVIQARIDALGDALARAHALGRLGDYRAALALEVQIAGEGLRLNAPAIVARARYLEGLDAHHVADADRSERGFREAARAAAEAGDDRLGAEIWVELLAMLIDYRRVATAETLLVAADAAVRRDRDRPVARARLIQVEGWLALHRGDFKAARERFTAALALVPVTDLGERIRALGNLATVESELADHPSAIAHRREVMALVAMDVGMEHPLYADGIAELGQAQRRAGEIEAALGSLRDAIRKQERAYGRDSGNVAGTLHTLANALSDAKQPAAAIAALERAVAIYEAAKSPRLDAALGSLAGMRYHAGDTAGAIRDMERALPALERRVGRDHFEYAAYEGNYGAMLECAKAMPYLDHAVAVLVKTVGGDHDYTRNTARIHGACQRELAQRR